MLYGCIAINEGLRPNKLKEHFGRLLLHVRADTGRLDLLAKASTTNFASFQKSFPEGSWAKDKGGRTTVQNRKAEAGMLKREPSSNVPGRLETLRTTPRLSPTSLQLQHLDALANASLHCPSSRPCPPSPTVSSHPHWRDQGVGVQDHASPMGYTARFDPSLPVPNCHIGPPVQLLPALRTLCCHASLYCCALWERHRLFCITSSSVQNCQYIRSHGWLRMAIWKAFTEGNEGKVRRMLPWPSCRT